VDAHGDQTQQRLEVEARERAVVAAHEQLALGEEAEEEERCEERDDRRDPRPTACPPDRASTGPRP
jgi:hypothetical protein